ncbi:MAG TPA: PASTA domain-containing protein [Salinivirgaceae bacterium]|nr:PASTA domain-containing protein [Salinivirgaceae bacterium]
MSLKAVIKDKIFWKHLGLAILSAIVFLWLVYLSLKIFTHHGRTYRVPDFSGLMFDEAQILAKHHKLEIVLNDSTYNPGHKPGTIISQKPIPDEKVKKGRRVFVTINAFSTPKVPMPNVTGVSFRQAQVSLELAGLTVGRLIYEPDPMKNYVLDQRYKGQQILPGTPIEKGQAVDLILGQGYGDVSTTIPDIIGMTFQEAKKVLQSEYINIGKVTYDKTVKTFADSTNARVFRQYPPAGRTIRIGNIIDLWLTLNDIEQTEGSN